MGMTDRGNMRHSKVQELQSAVPYTDIYPVTASHPGILMNQAGPPTQRWRGKNGFGIRHVHDDVPFCLWDDHAMKFRPASRIEMSYIIDKYNAERLNLHEWILTLETLNPPKPVPLTVAGMPARFVPPGEGRVNIYGLAPYPSRRIPDPCPQINWDREVSPTRGQMCDVINAISALVPIRRVNFLPATIVAEIEHRDNGGYSPKSLPGVVANRATTYHHDSESFFSSVRNHTRECTLDPIQHFSNTHVGPPPQDITDYINEPDWSMLSPGMRVCPGYATETDATVLPTTSGILLRKNEGCYITVSNHGFPDSQQVFHPTPDGDQIGDIVERHPEQDIAIVQPMPVYPSLYTNNNYFRAKPPIRFAKTMDMVPGAWFEIDGMSTGMLSLLYSGTSMEKQVSPQSHSPIPVVHWQQKNLFNMFGATSPRLVEGIRGAPIVQADTGLVAGFFYLATGDWAECAAVDDLVAEGWQVV